jgi:hypothetical protein
MNFEEEDFGRAAKALRMPIPTIKAVVEVEAITSLDNFVSLVLANHLDSYLRQKHWAAFTRAYHANASNYVDIAQQISAAYSKYAKEERRRGLSS